MERFETLLYEVDSGIARITLNRPERGNGIILTLVQELEAAVEKADRDPQVRVLALSGKGKGFCGGYDLVASAQGMATDAEQLTVQEQPVPEGSFLEPWTIARNHDPDQIWDPVLDYQMMSRNVKGFMSLFHANKPVVCKVHGFCVAGGTDMALCSDLLIIEDKAIIGYPPARVWGVPTTALWIHRIGLERTKRLLFTGDCLTGREAVAWGLGCEAPPIEELEERFERLLARIARMPTNQLVMMKMLTNQSLSSAGLQQTQMLGTLLDGVARHTPEGYGFQRTAQESGFKAAVQERDGAFGPPDLRILKDDSLGKC